MSVLLTELWLFLEGCVHTYQDGAHSWNNVGPGIMVIILGLMGPSLGLLLAMFSILSACVALWNPTPAYWWPWFNGTDAFQACA